MAETVLDGNTTPVIETSGAPAGGHYLVVKTSTTGGGSAVEGTTADGAAFSDNPVVVGGVDGSGNAQSLLTDTSGRPQIVIATALPAGTNNIGDVDVLTLPALPAGTNNIGDVDVASGPTGASALQGQGAAAHDAAVVGNPWLMGGYASATAPSDVSADGDAVRAWFRRNGALATYNAYGSNITDDNVLALVPGVVIRPTITISASPDYSAGDSIGGIVTLSSVMYASGRSAKLTSLTLKENGGQAPALTCIFFRATPSDGTYTDNAAIVWGSGDSANMIGAVEVVAGDWYTVASKSVATLAGLDQIHGAAASDLFLIIVADGAYNAGGASDLTAEISYQRM